MTFFFLFNSYFFLKYSHAFYFLFFEIIFFLIFSKKFMTWVVAESDIRHILYPLLHNLNDGRVDLCMLNLYFFWKISISPHTLFYLLFQEDLTLSL